MSLADVPLQATSIVHICPVVNVRPLHEWLRKVLPAVPVLIQASNGIVGCRHFRTQEELQH